MAEKPNIYQRLHAVMKDVGYVQKESKKVNNQYTFVSHDAVTAKLRPSLIENGIVPVTTVKSHTQDGNRTEVDIEVKFVNVDNPEDSVTVTAFGYGIDGQDKGPGKAISYAFKYACLKTFALETGDDPERDQIEYEPDYITEEQAANLVALAEEVGADLGKFCAYLKVDHIESIPASQYDTAVKALKKKREKEAA